MSPRDSKRFKALPSMMAWLNDYRPKPGRYIRTIMTRSSPFAALKPRKGKYKPARS